MLTIAHKQVWMRRGEGRQGKGAIRAGPWADNLGLYPTGTGTFLDNFKRKQLGLKRALCPWCAADTSWKAGAEETPSAQGLCTRYPGVRLRTLFPLIFTHRCPLCSRISAPMSPLQRGLPGWGLGDTPSGTALTLSHFHPPLVEMAWLLSPGGPPRLPRVSGEQMACLPQLCRAQP